jgi:hypothetical protein
VEEILSTVEPGRLLHFVHRKSEFGVRAELIDATQVLQLSSQSIPRGKQFRPHRHIPKRVEIFDITAQESWVVIAGIVEVSYFDLNDTLIERKILSEGDVSVTLAGGHGYRIIEEALIYEFKTGPYFGVESDKTFI